MAFGSQSLQRRLGVATVAQGGIQETLAGMGGLVGPLYGGVIAAQTSARTSLLVALVPLALAMPFIRIGRRNGPNAATARK